MERLSAPITSDALLTFVEPAKHFEMLTFLDDVEDIQRFAGHHYSKAKYYDFDSAYLLEMEPHVLDNEVFSDSSQGDGRNVEEGITIAQDTDDTERNKSILWSKIACYEIRGFGRDRFAVEDRRHQPPRTRRFTKGLHLPHSLRVTLCSW